MASIIDLNLQRLINVARDTTNDAELIPLGILPGQGGQPASARVMVQHDGTRAALEAAGLNIMSRVDNIFTGVIALNRIESLAAVEGVVRIEGGTRRRSRDLALPDINADDVLNAPGIGSPPQIYSGQNVIVGVIDSGIDFHHRAFRQSDGTTRIHSIVDFTDTAGPAAPGLIASTLWTRAQINADIASGVPNSVVRQRDTDGHGTHVACIAAGHTPANPPTSPERSGLASGAELIIVKTDGFDAEISAGLDYIYQQAAALGRPCVVNLSMGGHSGAHDGTSLLEQHMNKHMGTPGKALVLAAGNEGTDDIFSKQTILPGASATLTVSDAGTYDPTDPASALVTAAIEVWYPRGGQLDASATDFSGQVINLNQPAINGANASAVSPGGFSFDLDYEVSHPLNDKVQVIMAGDYNGITPPAGSWSLTLTNNGATPVTIEAWATRDWHAPFSGATNPCPQTVGLPATAQEGIAVGGYTSRTDTDNPVMGELYNFSSRGPTSDGRIKPDICAPGVAVTAADSRDATGADAFAVTNKSGTSMATPMVTGAVALLFEKNGALTQEQIRRGLAATARTDRLTGSGSNIPDNDWGAGKLDVAALVQHDFSSIATNTWVRIRPTFYNWTIADTPPSFEIFANENGRAIIELAWGSQDIPNPPVFDPAEPLRYYQTGEDLDVNVVKADGSNLHIDIDEQVIQLVDNKATWTMPQVLWDGYREELRKGGQTPRASQMEPMLYYRVRFEPTGAGSPVVWPNDDSFRSPLNNRMGIIGLNAAPATQVRPDQQAVDAMPRLKQQLEDLWDVLPETHTDHAALMAIFTHRLFTNHIETEIRGKILSLWMLAGPARQRLHLLIERMHRNEHGLEMTVFKQRCLRDNTMLIDHLLALSNIVPHPEIPGMQVSEQILDDVLNEILDPNGQGNQGDARVGVPSAIQTLMINANAAEYVRLLRGLLSPQASTTFANGDTVTLPNGIFRAILHAGAQGDPFLARTNSECAFQTAMMASALGNRFPTINAAAPPDAPQGANTALQRIMNDTLSDNQIERILDALLNKRHRAKTSTPSERLRNEFIASLEASGEPVLTHLCWNAPHGQAGAHEQAVVALRSEGGRVFFKNPRYAGSEPFAATLTVNSSASQPPRRHDDPLQALESIGSDDLAAWLTGYFPVA